MWKVGKVSVIDFENALVRVTFEDTGDQSGELSVITQRNESTKIYSMPMIDELGVCLLDGKGRGFYLGSFFSPVHPAPSMAGEGKFITDYGDGTVATYDKNSKVFNVVCSGKITLEATEGITLKAPKIEVDGAQSNTKTLDVADLITSKKDVVASGISLVEHIHGGVQGGLGSTKPPE